MTNLGMVLGHPLAPAQVLKDSRSELWTLGSLGSNGETWPVLGSPQADGGAELLRGSCLGSLTKMGQTGVKGRDSPFNVPSV